jgi:chemotaxis protein CheX
MSAKNTGTPAVSKRLYLHRNPDFLHAQLQSHAMDASYINPFITSTAETFSKMLNVQVELGSPQVKKDATYSYEISGIIGLTGDADGVIALNFPIIVALKIVSKLLYTEFPEVNLMVADGIGEIANIIAGNAKQYFNHKALKLSLPYVGRGVGGKIVMGKGIEDIVVPLNSDLGEFALEIALRIR